MAQAPFLNEWENSTAVKITVNSMFNLNIKSYSKYYKNKRAFEEEEKRFKELVN